MKIIFAGTPEFAAKSLEHMLGKGCEVIAVFTQPDKPAGRGQQLKASPVKQIAQQYNVPVYQPKTLRDDKVQAEIASLQAEVMVVAAYGLILPAAVLKIFKYGCINIHPSLLPRWRGAAPIQRTLLAGDGHTGVTIMQMDEGLDTGDMLLKSMLPISQEDTSISLHNKLADLGGELIVQALNQIATLMPEKQNNELATYAHKLTKEEANLDWKKSAIEIKRAVRAYQPWPIAYSYLQEQLIKIHACVVTDARSSQPPGTIIHADKTGIEVATGEGTLLLTYLQLPSGKVLSAQELLNSKANLFTSGQQFKEQAI